ncbi:Hsp70 family protein [Stackebrandtia soli]|uniref:Hsp70 family protein n=1 Tax=Stackebrandtia soli TaxID=1892856 RepID=UPI0039ED79CB
MSDFHLSVDYGTSNTVAVLSWPDGKSRPLHFGPSAVHAAPDGRLSTGNDAIRASRSDPSGLEPNPKRRIDDGEVLLGASALPVAALIAATLSVVRLEAERVAGGPIPVFTMTIPAGWAGPRRAVLAEAATLAGLPEPVFVPEPVAAASYFVTQAAARVPSGGYAVVYDLGAGTFDVSVVRRHGDAFEVLAVDGLDDVGGLDLDQVLIERIGAALTDEERDAWRNLLAPTDNAAMRARHELWRDVRDAKEALSRQPSASLYLPLVDREVHVVREEFERHATSILEPTTVTMMRAVADSGVGAQELAGVFLVGGASRTPLVTTLAHRASGIAPIAVEQPELVVAEGGLRASVFTSAPPPAPAPPHPTRTIAVPPSSPCPEPPGTPRRRDDSSPKPKV